MTPLAEWLRNQMAQRGLAQAQILRGFRRIPDGWKPEAIAVLQIFNRLAARPIPDQVREYPDRG